MSVSFLLVVFAVIPFTLKNFDAAEEHYREAINLHWGSADAHYNLGCLLQHQRNDLVEAERQYRQAVTCDPAHGLAQYNLGWALEKVGINSGAIMWSTTCNTTGSKRRIRIYCCDGEQPW